MVDRFENRRVPTSDDLGVQLCLKSEGRRIKNGTTRDKTTRSTPIKIIVWSTHRGVGRAQYELGGCALQLATVF